MCPMGTAVLCIQPSHISPHLKIISHKNFLNLPSWFPLQLRSHTVTHELLKFCSENFKCFDVSFLQIPALIMWLPWKHLTMWVKASLYMRVLWPDLIQVRYPVHPWSLAFFPSAKVESWHEAYPSVSVEGKEYGNLGYRLQKGIWVFDMEYSVNSCFTF